MANSRVDFAEDGWSFSTERVASAISYARRGGKTREWRDTHPQGSGLRLRVGKRSAVFFARCRVEGTMSAVKLGPAEGEGRLSVDAARRALAQVKGGHGVPDRASSADPADTTPVLGPVIDACLEDHASGVWYPPRGRAKKPTDRTMLNYANVRRACLQGHEGLTLAQFAEQLPAIHKAIHNRAPVQADRMAQLVRNVFNYATANSLWGGPNPADGTIAKRLPKSGVKPRQTVLTREQWQALDEALDAEANPVWGAMFRVSIGTLMRMGAVVHMEWSDLSLGKNPEWRIPARWMKGRKGGHTVPLDVLPEVLEILKARRKVVPKGCPWVFPSPSDPSRPAERYSKAWDRSIRRAGLWSEDAAKRPRPHDLRRTGGGRMTEAEVPLQTVTAALGNSPSSAAMVAQTYAQVTSKAVRDAYAKVGRRSNS